MSGTPFTKTEKLRTFGFYIHGMECACGAPKERIHWCCKPCKEKHWESPQAHKLRDACQAHVSAARDFQALCAKK